jgi:hypothetical protein
MQAKPPPQFITDKKKFFQLMYSYAKRASSGQVVGRCLRKAATVNEVCSACAVMQGPRDQVRCAASGGLIGRSMQAKIPNPCIVYSTLGQTGEMLGGVGGSCLRKSATEK